MTITHAIMWVLTALLGLTGSALCNGMEIGSYSLNRVRLRLRAAGRGATYSARLLAREMAQPDRVLAAMLIGNTLFGYLSATALTALMSAAGYGDVEKVLIEVAILTPLLLVLAESLPKELFRADADRLVYLFAPYLTAARLLLTWTGVLPLIRWITEFAARRLQVEEEQGLALSGREHVAAMLKESGGTGVLSASQVSLVDRALEFHRVTVGDEMVPWARVQTIPESWDRPRVLALLRRSHHSRFPVVDSKDRVIGVLRHTDPYVHPDADLRSLAVEPARLAPGTPLREAILRVREAPGGVGIVESGGKPIGLVTPKDLIEPLTGEMAPW